VKTKRADITETYCMALNISTLRELLITTLLCVPFLTLRAEVPDLEVLSFSTQISIVDHQMRLERSFKIQFNSREGDKGYKVSIPYTSKSRILTLRAWMQDTTGKVIREFKKNEFSDVNYSMEGVFFSGEFFRGFEPKHNVYPYQLCYTYTQTFPEFISVADWTPVISPEITTRSAELAVDLPEDYRIRIYQDHASPPETDTAGGLVHYLWKASYDPVIRLEEFSLPIEDLVAHVIVMPIDFLYSARGSSENWETFGDYFATLAEGAYILGDGEPGTVRQLIRNVTDDHEKVRILYHYLQDRTRYVNVSINTGGLKPYPASFTGEKKYGDCKGLCVYMQALLAAAGIPSFYALVAAGDSHEQFLEEIPSQQFNHVMVMVPLNRDTVWLECTSSILPAGYTGTFTQDREAFVIERGNSHFVRIPALAPEDVSERRVFHFDTDETGETRARMSGTMKGPSFEELKAIQALRDKNPGDDQFRNFLPFPDYQVLKSRITVTNRDALEATLDAELLLPHFYTDYGNKRTFRVPSSGMPDFERLSKRRLPVEIPFPIFRDDSMAFRIPIGFIPQIPADVLSDQPYGLFRVTFEVRDGCLTVHRTVYLRKGKYSLPDYGKFSSFVSAIRDWERSTPIVFNRTP
jgi:hypothetical protein